MNKIRTGPFLPAVRGNSSALRRVAAYFPATFDLLVAQDITNHFMDSVERPTYIVTLVPEDDFTCMDGNNPNEALLTVGRSDDARVQWFNFAHQLSDILYRGARGSDRTVHYVHGELWCRKMVTVIKHIQDVHKSAEQRVAEKRKDIITSEQTRIAHKKKLIENLERRIQALQTRVATHRRSIAALRRAAKKKHEVLDKGARP